MNSLSNLLEEINKYKYFVADAKFLSLWPEIHTALKSKKVFCLDSPEENKNFEIYQQAIDFFLSEGITRDSHLIVIGGGATSDFGGFIASTILRGIKWSVVPTTLLAAVDASVGGKVGINHQKGKNLIGSFHLPENNYFYYDFLKTLAEEEMQSGKGEVLKYCFLSQEIFDLVNMEGLSQKTVQACIDYKMQIVEKDFYEKGERIQLNLGHTLGHALEKCENIPHGLCVAWGLEKILELFSPSLLDHFYTSLKKLELTIPEVQKLDKDAFFSYLKSDKKKNIEGEISIIIPRSIGEIEIKKIETKELKDIILSNDNTKNYF